MKRILTIAAVLGLLWAEPQPAFAQFYDPEPWCAVVNTGWGNIVWDCQCWSLEQCRPNVLAGNRGFATRTQALSRGSDGPIASETRKLDASVENLA